MIKPDSYHIAEPLKDTIAAADTIKPYSQVLNRMVSSVWKLLLINTLILIVVLYTLVFTDAQRQDKDLYLTHVILNVLIFYLILVPCIKALVHLGSLYICRTRLDLYKIKMAEIISESDYATYIQQPLRKIHIMFLTYPLVILAHLAMVFTCYYLKFYVL